MILVFFLQEELYDLILQTNKESIKLCKPGTTIRQLNTYSVYINLSSTVLEMFIIYSFANVKYIHLCVCYGIYTLISL